MNDKRIKAVLMAIRDHKQEPGRGHLAAKGVTSDDIHIVCGRGLVTRGGQITLKGSAFLQTKSEN